MYKKLLKLLFLLVALLLMLGVFPSTETVAVQSKEDRILQQITDTYDEALRGSKRYSFRGYCGTFVNWHVYLLGITSTVSIGNGNQQYDMYAKQTVTSGGFTVEALPVQQYSMKEALNMLSANGTVNVYNLIAGFQRTNTTAGRKYGHAVFIHAVINGMVYFSESFSTNFMGTYYPEGTPIVCTIDQFCNYYSTWTTYEGMIHFGLKTYQDECEFFPAYLYATVDQQTQLYTAACTPDVDASSTVVRSLYPGERLNVIGMYRNTKGEYWYQVKDVDICYVPASHTVMESLRYDDVTVTDISAPTEQRQGKIFNIQGNIKSTYNQICSVRAQVFTITDQGMKHWMTTTDTVTDNSYSLSYSVVSNRMAFRLLEQGSYRYEMAVVVSNHYFADGLLQTQWTTLKLWCSDFRVVEEKGGTASVEFDTCGGVANLNAAEMELGQPLGELPEASREGYRFDGWYTAQEGGLRVDADYVLQGDLQLYAHWTESDDVNGWFEEDSKLFYVIDGQRVEGFFQVDGITYYQTQGYLATGWLELEESRYYFHANGTMTQGWLEIDRCQYYFGVDGTATIGWAEVDGKTYYFGEDCAMLIGKHTIEGVEYTFDASGILMQ